MSRRRITDALVSKDYESTSQASSSTQNNLPAVRLSEKTHSHEDKKRQMVYSVSPEVCLPWHYHDRDNSWLTEKGCSDLIASIKNNGQKIPAIARRINTEDGIQYEIIAGARRWFACKSLGINLILSLTDRSDKECAILMHIENKDRKDISDFERALSYKSQLESGVFASNDDLANSLGLSKATISKTLSAAKLIDYDFVMKIIEDIKKISLISAYKVCRILEDPTLLKKTKQLIDNIKRQQSKVSASFLFKKILLLSEKDKEAPNKFAYKIGNNCKLNVTNPKRRKYVFEIEFDNNTPPSQEELIKGLEKAAKENIYEQSV